MPADPLAPKVTRASAGMAPVPLNIELNSIELDSGMENGISIEFDTQFDQIRPIRCLAGLEPEPWFNIKMTSYQYRKSHCEDKTILRPSYLHNGISYTGKTTSLYWIRALVLAV